MNPYKFTNVVIEKDIPVPKKMQYLQWKARYPFHKMQKNDSFFLPENPRIYETVYKLRSRVNCAFYQAKKKKRLPSEYQIITRTVKENGKIGVRVWRVS